MYHSVTSKEDKPFEKKFKQVIKRGFYSMSQSRLKKVIITYLYGKTVIAINKKPSRADWLYTV